VRPAKFASLVSSGQIASMKQKLKKNEVSLVLLSDTHELHRDVDVPHGDVLIHAGDFSVFSRSMRAIADFN
jgi:hypothetical protein